MALLSSVAPLTIHSSIVLLVIGAIVTRVEARPRAFFVFGDSIVDSGNNNYLFTPARADAPPYGIDYPPTHRPTGRFSNGYNLPDLISEKLNAECTLPYMSPKLKGDKLLVGANFASAGVGILNDTGIYFEYQNRLSALIGASEANKLVKRALVLISVGGNDFVNNYFLPNSARSLQYPLPRYVKYLISEYQKLLQRLYDLGARRVLVTGTGPLGCVPSELAQHGINGQCARELQRAAALFNPQLVQMLLHLNRKIGSDVFIAANAHSDFLTNPQQFGFITSQVACCGQGPYNGLGPCTILSNLCSNRDQYVFWDAFHPSEKAIRIIVEDIMSGSKASMNPMNLSTILALDAINT